MRAGSNGEVKTVKIHCLYELYGWIQPASGLYCKILTLYKIIKLIQCTTNAWFLLRFISFLRLFLFVYKNTNSSDVWSHRRRECLLLGIIPPRTSLQQLRCYLAYDNIVDCGKGVQTNSINLKIVPADHYSTNNLLLFLVTGLSTR